MFCDLVGSTALSARIDPEEMHDLVEHYYGAIADDGAVRRVYRPLLGRWRPCLFWLAQGR
jgi:hypothetical protein